MGHPLNGALATLTLVFPVRRRAISWSANLSHVVMLFRLAQDCNLVAYSGLAATDGFNAATAVYYSATYTDAANAPCNLFVSSTGGGSIFIADKTGAVVYQEPVLSPRS